MNEYKPGETAELCKCVYCGLHYTNGYSDKFCSEAHVAAYIDEVAESYGHTNSKPRS